MSDFEKWLKTVCFQEPPRDVRIFAETAWNAALKSKCDHNWVDATNKVVSGMDLCLKCSAVRATPAEVEHEDI